MCFWDTEQQEASDRDPRQVFGAGSNGPAAREEKRSRSQGEATRREPTPCQMEASRDVLTY